jgi:predicted small lipoprotein YifL
MNCRLRDGVLILIAILLFGVSACGQMGPLVLPDEIVDDPDNGSDDSDDSDEENER